MPFCAARTSRSSGTLTPRRTHQAGSSGRSCGSTNRSGRPSPRIRSRRTRSTTSRRPSISFWSSHERGASSCETMSREVDARAGRPGPSAFAACANGHSGCTLPEWRKNCSHGTDICTSLLVAVLLSVWAQRPFAFQDQHDHGSPTGRLGTVHFATSCSTAVAQDFDRGVALLHSFWFSAAIDAFNGVLKSDPSCAMAHWGIAMSWWGNPFGGFRSPQALQAGLAAVEKGKAAGAKTERERGYIAAVEVLFKDAATIPQRTRTLEYEKRMAAALGEVRRRSRSTHLLRAGDGSDGAADRQDVRQPAEGGRPFSRRNSRGSPTIPGLAHYIIHSFDAPPLAPRALDAARRYAKIAPAAPHALHMPSHTFTRVGAWQESIETNIASAAAARKDNAASEELHALDYQVYAYLQTAQDAAAKKSLDEIAAIGARIQHERRRRRRAAAGRLLRAGRDSRPLCARAERVEGGGRLDAARNGVRVCRRDHLLRACARCGAKRQPRGRREGRREARRRSRDGAAEGQRRLLDRAGGHPAAHRARLDRAGRGPAGRCAHHAPRGRRRWRISRTRAPSRPAPSSRRASFSARCCSSSSARPTR